MFEPDFTEGDFEDHKCYVLARVQDGRRIFAGCKSELSILKMRELNRKAGLPWNYQVVVEFDRDLDDI